MAKYRLPRELEKERTHRHKQVEKWLVELGVDFISECKDFLPYRIDIYLPEFHACIEVDGPWHSRKKDDVRDDALIKRYALPTWRIKSKSKMLDKKRIILDIIQFIEIWAPSAERRKYHACFRSSRQRMTVRK